MTWRGPPLLACAMLVACNGITDVGIYQADCPNEACNYDAGASDASSGASSSGASSGGTGDAGGCPAGEARLSVTVRNADSQIAVTSIPAGVSVASGHTQQVCLPADRVRLSSGNRSVTWSGVGCKDQNPTQLCEFTLTLSGASVTVSP